MEFIVNTIDQLNWWAVLVAALVPFPIGYLWYDKNLGFGKKWAKMVGLKVSELGKMDGMGKSFATLAVFALATSVVIGCLMKATGTSGLLDSTVFGVVIGVIVRGGAHFVHNGFARRPIELTLTDVGHDMVSIVAMTIVLGLWA